MSLVAGGDISVCRRSSRQGNQSNKVNRSYCSGQSSSEVTVLYLPKVPAVPAG